MIRLHTLAVRLARLARWYDTLLAKWQALSPAQRRALLDTVTLELIRDGVLPSPVPDQRNVSIDALRRMAPEVMRQWHRVYLGNQDWHAQHPEAVRAAVARLARWARPTAAHRWEQTATHSQCAGQTRSH